MLLQEPNRKKRSDVDLVMDDELSSDDEEIIRCANCEAELTRPANRISRDGRHIHVFTNPHGYTFQIACFDAVPGAVSTGEPSDEWAWFAGTVWRIAICRACLSHIGWSFDTGETYFWGLITAKLL